MKQLSKSDKLSFGKYKGETIGELLEYDPQYLSWAIGLEIFTVSTSLHDEIRHAEMDMYELDEEYYIGCPEQN